MILISETTVRKVVSLLFSSSVDSIIPSHES